MGLFGSQEGHRLRDVGLLAERLGTNLSARGHHPAFDEPGRDHVDRDPRLELGGSRRTRQDEERRLGHGVGRDPRKRAEMLDAMVADVDDSAPAPLPHTRESRLADMHRAQENAAEHALPIGPGQFLPRLDEDRPEIVDENVQPAERALDVADQVPSAALARQIGPKGLGRLAFLLDLGQDLFGGRFVFFVVDRDPGDVIRQPDGDLPADPPAAGGNERDPIIVHRLLPSAGGHSLLFR